MFIGLVVIVLGYYFYTQHQNNVAGSSKGEDALDVLKMRYVNGEIDEDVYQKMKKTLNS